MLNYHRAACFIIVIGAAHAIVWYCGVHSSRVYEKYPYLLAEMYAYSMAAAHEKLPHLQVESFMVSNIDAGGEGWPHVDALEHVCLPPNADGIYYPGRLMPTVVHFCQSYRIGDLGFMKRRVPHNIFNCDSPMLVDPPVNIGEGNYLINKDGKVSCHFHMQQY